VHMRHVAGEEQHGVGDVVRLDHAAQRDLAGTRRLLLGRRDLAAAAEPGRGRPGADGVDADPVRRQLVGSMPREPEEAGLRGAVIGAAAERDAPPGDRGDVDDRAAAAPLHMRDHRLGAVERAAQIDRHDAVPVGGRHRRDRLAGDRAGRIDQHIDAACFRRDLGRQPGEGGAVGDIERVAGGIAADLGSDPLCGAAVAVERCHACASRGERAAAGGADAVAATGYQRDLSGEIEFHAGPPRDT
jgi:hypothetical protein